MLRQPLNLTERLARFWIHTILHADDPPERIALGVAIGTFVAFTPTVGIQMAIVLLLTWCFRANKAISLPIVWISNPLTLVPIYWACYHVGRFLLNAPSTSADWWSGLSTPPAGFAQIRFYWDRFAEIAWPIWVGGLVVGFVSGYATYYATLALIRRHRGTRSLM